MSDLLLYNIRKTKYTENLSASGMSNRWNKQEEYVLYTAQHRSLAALELVAHRASIQVKLSYSMVEILISDLKKKDIYEVDRGEMPDNWKSIMSYPILQEIGSRWYRSRDKLLMKVPSVLVPQEYNYLIHTRHPDFEKKVSIKRVDIFGWDKRLL